MPQHNCFVFECEKMVCFLVYLCLQCFLLLHKLWHTVTYSYVMTINYCLATKMVTEFLVGVEATTSVMLVRYCTSVRTPSFEHSYVWNDVMVVDWQLGNLFSCSCTGCRTTIITSFPSRENSTSFIHLDIDNNIIIIDECNNYCISFQAVMFSFKGRRAHFNCWTGLWLGLPSIPWKEDCCSRFSEKVNRNGGKNQNGRRRERSIKEKDCAAGACFWEEGNAQQWHKWGKTVISNFLTKMQG